jgi:hypothetical protein
MERGHFESLKSKLKGFFLKAKKIARHVDVKSFGSYRFCFEWSVTGGKSLRHCHHREQISRIIVSQAPPPKTTHTMKSIIAAVSLAVAASTAADAFAPTQRQCSSAVHRRSSLIATTPGLFRSTRSRGRWRSRQV